MIWPRRHGHATVGDKRYIPQRSLIPATADFAAQSKGRVSRGHDGEWYVNGIRHSGNLLLLSATLQTGQRGSGHSRLVRKLENLARFSLGPSVESVFTTGLTSSEWLGDGKPPSTTVSSSRCAARPKVKYPFAWFGKAPTLRGLERPCCDMRPHKPLSEKRSDHQRTHISMNFLPSALT